MNVRFREVAAKDVKPGDSILQLSDRFLPALGEVVAVGLADEGAYVDFHFASTSSCNDFIVLANSSVLVADI